MKMQTDFDSHFWTSDECSFRL